MHLWFGLFAILVVIFSIILTQSLDCDNAFECAYSSLSETGSTFIECYGYFSCFSATAIFTTASRIYCWGSYSCYQSNIVTHNGSSTNAEIFCMGLYSCAMVDYLYNAYGNIECFGELSCFGSNIYQTTEALLCDGDRSCANSTIYSQGYVNVLGSFGAQNSTFYSNATTVYYNFYGQSR